MEEEINNLNNAPQDNKDLQPPKKKAEKKEKKFSFNSILSFTAFIGIGCIAISLLLTLVFENDIKLSAAFSSIGQVIAYVLCIILAFSWVKKHKQIPWIVCYVVFVVTIVVLFILTI